MSSIEELKAVVRLLNCPDLNLEELEDETVEAMEEVRRVFKVPEHFNPDLGK